MHAQVFEYLCELTGTLVKVSERGSRPIRDVRLCSWAKRFTASCPRRLGQDKKNRTSLLPGGGGVALTVGSVLRRIIFNYINLIDCSFSTANRIDVI